MLRQLLPRKQILSREGFFKPPALRTPTQSIFASRPLHVSIPFVPAQIDLPRLHVQEDRSLYLLKQESLALIKHKMNSLKDGKYNMQTDLPALGIKSDYSIIKIGDKLYALYDEENPAKYCGIGSLAVAQFAQDIETGEWIVVKVQSIGII